MNLRRDRAQLNTFSRTQCSSFSQSFLNIASSQVISFRLSTRWVGNVKSRCLTQLLLSAEKNSWKLHSHSCSSVKSAAIMCNATCVHVDVDKCNVDPPQLGQVDCGGLKLLWSSCFCFTAGSGMSFLFSIFIARGILTFSDIFACDRDHNILFCYFGPF